MAELTSGWAIDGPVKTPVSDARRLVYGLSGDAHGVASTSDLVVRPTSPPGGAVRVSIGSALIKSRYSEGETYLATANATVEIPVTQTPSNAGRTDLVVFEVRDPWAQNSPWAPPSNPDTYEFFKLHIIRGVSASAKYEHLHEVPGYANKTGIILARLNIPANRADVQLEMITRLAEPHTPKRLDVTYARPRIGADDDPRHNYLAATISPGTAGEYFPGGGDSPNRFTVFVPPWATRMVIDARWMSIFYKAGVDPRGAFWIEYGDEWKDTWPNGGAYEFRTQWFWFNSTLSNDARSDNWLLMDEVPVPAKLRGKTISFVFKAGLEYKPDNQSVFMNSKGGLGMRITFADKTIAPDMI